LNFNKQVQKLADHIVSKAGNMSSINGRSPTTLASAAIYIAAEIIGTPRSLEDISKICGAAVTTIKQICKQMQANLSDMLPDEYKLKLVNGKIAKTTSCSDLPGTSNSFKLQLPFIDVNK
jgi:hypothetical protein